MSNLIFYKIKQPNHCRTRPTYTKCSQDEAIRYSKAIADAPPKLITNYNGTTHTLDTDCIESDSLGVLAKGYNIRIGACGIVNGLVCSKIIPALDIDSFNGLMVAAIYLSKAHGIQCNVFESSEGHYWAIPNVFGSQAQMRKLIKCVPGVDRKYVSNTIDYNMWIIRGTIRKDFTPRLTAKSNNNNKHVEKFVLSLEEHFQRCSM